MLESTLDLVLNTVFSCSFASASMTDVTGCGFFDVGDESLNRNDGGLNSFLAFLDVSDAWPGSGGVAAPLVDSAVAVFSVFAVVDAVRIFPSVL